MKKIIAFFVVLLLLTFMMFGCSEFHSEEQQAIAVTKKYVTAIEQDDLKTEYECYDPKLQSGAKALADNGGNLLFGLSGGYDLGLSFGGLFSSAYKEALGIKSIEFDFVEVKECNLEKNYGTIESIYNFVAKSDSAETQFKVTLKFKMIKNQDKWYLADEPTCEYDTQEAQENLKDIN